LRAREYRDFVNPADSAISTAMMDIKAISAPLFYDFCLEEHVPVDHVLGGVDCHLALDGLRHHSPKPFYSRWVSPSSIQN
jgi:hypothetical protein